MGGGAKGRSFFAKSHIAMIKVTKDLVDFYFFFGKDFLISLAPFLISFRGEKFIPRV